MRVILRDGACQGKSNRGTPRLRQMTGTLQGALRLALRAPKSDAVTSLHAPTRCRFGSLHAQP